MKFSCSVPYNTTVKASSVHVSVVIPCYNEEAYIGDTLRSLLAQTYKNYEVIVVDNNCTDATAAIARKHSARVVREITPGVCAARQAGTEAARGEIIISTDADTQFSPDWLRRIVDSFDKDPSQVAVGGPCQYYDGPWWRTYTKVLFGWSYLHYRLFGWPWYMTATNIAFRKTAWRGYDLTLTQGGDELAVLHQLKRAGRVRFMLGNSTYTSGRRLEQGVLYSIFVTFLFYYVAGYYVNRAFKREIIGTAPPFRSYSAKRLLAYRFGWGLSLLVLAGSLVYGADHGMANPVNHVFEDGVAVVERLL